jgi:hypothetical protein
MRLDQVTDDRTHPAFVIRHKGRHPLCRDCKGGDRRRRKGAAEIFDVFKGSAVGEIGGKQDAVELSRLDQVIQSIGTPLMRRCGDRNRLSACKVNDIDVVCIGGIQHARHELGAPNTG